MKFERKFKNLVETSEDKEKSSTKTNYTNIVAIGIKKQEIATESLR